VFSGARGRELLGRAASIVTLRPHGSGGATPWSVRRNL